MQLSPENRCLLYGKSDRPRVCTQLSARLEMCGTSSTEALSRLSALEKATLPD